jgi:hypothetical protein
MTAKLTLQSPQAAGDEVDAPSTSRSSPPAAADVTGIDSSPPAAADDCEKEVAAPARAADDTEPTGAPEEEAVPPPPVAPRDWKTEAVSLEHLISHKPFNIYCDVCRRSKPQRKAKPDRAKQRAKSADGDPINGRDKLAFGDRCTGDFSCSAVPNTKARKKRTPMSSLCFLVLRPLLYF